MRRAWGVFPRQHCIADPAPSPEERASAAETLAILQEAISALDPLARRGLIASRVQGAPGSAWRLHREWFDRSALADRLGAEAGAVRSSHARDVF
ncbi:MAG: hypothetical protein ACREXK_02230 [Gammaproteobacteria bacterium]